MGERLRQRDSLGASDSGSVNRRDSVRSNVLPPGFDLSQFKAYTQSDEAVSNQFSQLILQF